MECFQPSRALRACIIPADLWNGDTGIAALLERYRDENPELFYSETRIRPRHRTAHVRGIDC